MLRQRTISDMFQRRQVPLAATEAAQVPVVSRNRFAGQIRVGTRVYERNGQFKDPSYPGFNSIVCLTASTAYGSLGPYVVRVIEPGPEQGALIENVWHAFKALPEIPKVEERVSRYNQTIAWSWPHVTDHLTPDRTHLNMSAWTRWHDTLAHNRYPIRYPFSFDPTVRATTIGVVPRGLLQQYRSDPINTRVPVSSLLGIAAGRKDVYFHYYIAAVKQQRQYQTLLQKLERGEKLLIIDVDGPREESLQYYRETYGVAADWIQERTVLIDEPTLEIVLNDTRHSCGHTFGLAAALMNLEHLFQ